MDDLVRLGCWLRHTKHLIPEKCSKVFKNDDFGTLPKMDPLHRHGVRPDHPKSFSFAKGHMYIQSVYGCFGHLESISGDIFNLKTLIFDIFKYFLLCTRLIQLMNYNGEIQNRPET